MSDSLVFDLVKIFEGALSSVNPSSLIKQKVSLEDGNILSIDEKTSFQIDHNVYIVGFGKAVLAMAKELDSILGDHLKGGVISIPKGMLIDHQIGGGVLNESVVVMGGAERNMPDAESFKAAKSIVELVKSLQSTDVLIVLISGGGSALFPYPISEITIEDKIDTINLLQRSGVPIEDLNCIRGHLSEVKCGGLLKMCPNQLVISLILSDCIGDPLGVIGGGPTVKTNESFSKVAAILQEYGIFDKLPYNVKDYFKRKIQAAPSGTGGGGTNSGTTPAATGTGKGGAGSAVLGSVDSGSSPKVVNVLIGNNKIAVDKACQTAFDLGYQSVKLTTSMTGEARRIGALYAQLIHSVWKLCVNPDGIYANEKSINLSMLGLDPGVKSDIIQAICQGLSSHKVGLALVAGGETTVTLKGNGRGGRNQELALSFGFHLDAFFKDRLHTVRDYIAILCAGTDGIDGPTDAAGAVLFPSVITDAQKRGLDPLRYLEDNNSYKYLNKIEEGKYLLKTGHSGTNVMDLHVILVKFT